MKRMLLQEYRRTAFAGRPPSANALRGWIQSGDLPGEKIGGSWFVHVDDNGDPVQSGDALADRALERWQDSRSP